MSLVQRLLSAQHVRRASSLKMLVRIDAIYAKLVLINQKLVRMYAKSVKTTKRRPSLVLSGVSILRNAQRDFTVTKILNVDLVSLVPIAMRPDLPHARNVELILTTLSRVKLNVPRVQKA